MWKVLTLYFPPMVVPRISSVFLSFKEIITSKQLLQMIGMTCIRLLIGLCIGIGCGTFIGIWMGKNQIVKEIVMPLIKTIQTIPPVSFLVLALIWFGFNGKPSIFIVVSASLPITTINVCKGYESIDPTYIEMGDLYQFSKYKKIRHIILPSIKPYFDAAFEVSLGVGWKICVMGEVLTVTNGIGGMIKEARLNMEPEMIIAWSCIVVLLFELSNFLAKKLSVKGGYHD